MANIEPPLHDDASGLRFFRREPDGSARRLVALLHGYGANGADLAEMESRFSERIPNTAWLRPEAPHRVTDGLSEAELAALRQARPGVEFDTRRTWATRTDGTSARGGPSPSKLDVDAALSAAIEPVEAAIEPAVAAVNRLIDTELGRLGLDDSALALYGFSQGGLAALHTGLSRDRPCAAVVSHSGQFYGMSAVASTPPVLLLVGEKEVEEGRPGKVIFPWSARALRDAGIAVEEYVAKGLGHGSSRRSDVVISRFIERAFQELGR